jgi:hypothetical protein
VAAISSFFLLPSLATTLFVTGAQVAMLFRYVTNDQKTIIISVHGTVKAQYTQNLSCITESFCHCSNGIENNAAKNVGGKNNIVMIATVFIALLSLFVASAIFKVASASL